jgi:hypothetical protein
VVTLRFDNAGEVSVDAPVVTRTTMYSSVASKPGGTA